MPLEFGNTFTDPAIGLPSLYSTLIDKLDELNGSFSNRNNFNSRVIRTMLLPLYYRNFKTVNQPRLSVSITNQDVSHIIDDREFYNKQLLTNERNSLQIIQLTGMNPLGKAALESVPVIDRMILAAVQVAPNMTVRLIQQAPTHYALLTTLINPGFLSRIPLLLSLLFQHLKPNPELPEDLPYLDYLQALAQHDSDKALDLLQYVMKDYTADRERILQAQVLTKWMENNKGNAVSNLQSQIKSVTDDIHTYEERVLSRLQTLTAYQKELFFLSNKPDNQSAEFVRFLLKRKDIIKVQINDNNSLLFVLLVPCTNYDMDIVEQFTKHEGTYFQKHSDAFTKVFVTQEHTLYLHSVVTLDFNRHSVSATTEWNSDYCDKGLPNYHHRHFNCWGSGKNPIQSALQKEDYILAMELMASNCHNLNFYEADNMNTLFKSAMNQTESVYAKPCVDLNDGSPWLTWKEYIELNRRK